MQEYVKIIPSRPGNQPTPMGLLTTSTAPLFFSLLLTSLLLTPYSFPLYPLLLFSKVLIPSLLTTYYSPPYSSKICFEESLFNRLKFNGLQKLPRIAWKVDSQPLTFFNRSLLFSNLLPYHEWQKNKEGCFPYLFLNFRHSVPLLHRFNRENIFSFFRRNICAYPLFIILLRMLQQ